MENAGATVDQLVASCIWSGRRGREHLTRAGGVEHPQTDEAAVERFVARSAARDQPDLAGDRCVAAVDDLVLVVDPQVGVGSLDAGKGVGHDGRRDR